MLPGHSAQTGNPMTLSKSSIMLSFDEEALHSLRRILFRKGVSPQEFFAFIIERISLEDERTEALLQELCNLKSDELIRGGVDRRHVNADSLYEAIEAQTQKKDTDNELDLFEDD